MQDSLEDYIRLVRNGKAEDPLKNSKDILQNAKLKKETDMRAMKIVEFSIEGKLRAEIFTRCLPFINQEHYQDIVEERSITKICGYPICGKKIPEMPKKQYYISTKSNKVYDITDRKVNKVLYWVESLIMTFPVKEESGYNKICNFCYKASLHIKSQIDNSPLWLRKAENIPEYKLLHSSEGGLPGEFIDQGISKPALESTFTAVSSFTQASLEEMVEREMNPPKPKTNIHRKCSKLPISTMQTISENNEQLEEELPHEIPKKIPEKVILKNIKVDCSKQLVCKKLPVIDEKEEKIEGEDVKKTKKRSSKSTKIDLETKIKKCVNEWISLETYIYLYGDTKVKEILNERKLGNLFDTLHVTDLDLNQQARYMDICRRLHLQELLDDKFDQCLIGNNNLKPIPDYKKLKEDYKDVNLKVKSFYLGVPYEKEDSNFPQSKTNSEEEKTEEGEGEGPPAVLPLVDANSQTALRRKIFLNSMNKAMQLLLQSLRMSSYAAVLSDVQALVKTFKLKADNIVFKPTVWNYISIVLLKILSIKDKNLKKILDEKKSQEYLELSLSLLPNKCKFLEDVLNSIQNIDLFLKNYITSN